MVMPKPASRSILMSENVTSGSCGTGSPEGTWPTTATPRDSRSNTTDATVASTTAMSGPGSDGPSQRSSRMTASVLAATVLTPSQANAQRAWRELLDEMTHTKVVHLAAYPRT